MARIMIIFSVLFFATSIEAKEIILPVYPSQGKVDWNYYKVKKGDFLQKLFGEHWLSVARFNRIDGRRLIVGMMIKVPKNLEKAKSYEPLPIFIKEKKNAKKFIFVSLVEQWFGFYEYGKLVFSGPISSGKKECVDAGKNKKRSCETPEGEFYTLAVHKNHASSKYKYSNGKNIPMPFGVFIEKGGYWLHEGVLPGWPDSHGCIRLMKEDARRNCNNVYEKCFNTFKQIWIPKEERILVEIKKLPYF